MTGVLLVHASIAFIIVCFAPSEAFAWGPGMHVEVALAALAAPGLLAPVIRELVHRFPEAFIYGAASPDIVVGKKYAGYFHHCHNWRMGRMILHGAASDRQRAAAYGYLLHLAADIVAHNYYIPVKIVRSFRARLLSHTYWEMRFDLGVSEEVWKRLRTVTRLDIEEFDEVLERTLRTTLFSFSTNKRIFNAILMIHKMKGLRQSLGLYARHSRYGIEEENRQHYVDLTMEAALAFLARPNVAPCLAVDPAGLRKLAYAKELRREIRELRRRRAMTAAQAERFVELVRERLAVGLYRPEMVLPNIGDLV